MVQEVADDIGQMVDGSWQQVSWDFKDGDDKNLSDGDHIKLEMNCDQGVDKEYVRFGLVESGTWWKSITVHDGGKFLYELVAVQDTPGVIKYADVPVANLELYHFVHSKAKLFGIHTDMYEISNATEMQGGCAYTWKWLSD